MINVNFLNTEKGVLVGFDIYGHANYDEKGYDIVCAAVSSAVYMTANMITEIIKVSAEIRTSGFGAMYLKIEENNASLCNDVLLGLKLHLINLEEQYPENITVNYVEV